MLSSLPRRRRLVGHRFDLLGDVLHRAIEARAPAHAVDRLEAAGRHEPRARVRRHAVARPLLERRAERVVQRLFGEVEVAEKTDQRGEHAPRLGAVDRRPPSRAHVRPNPRSPASLLWRMRGVLHDRSAIATAILPRLVLRAWLSVGRTPGRLRTTSRLHRATSDKSYETMRKNGRDCEEPCASSSVPYRHAPNSSRAPAKRSASTLRRPSLLHQPQEYINEIIFSSHGDCVPHCWWQH